MADSKKAGRYERENGLAILRIQRAILLLGLISRIFGKMRKMSEGKKIVKKRNECEDMSNVEEADSDLEEKSEECDLHREKLNIATGCGREEWREKRMTKPKHYLCVETTQSQASKKCSMTLIVVENHTSTRLLSEIHRKEGEGYGGKH